MCVCNIFLRMNETDVEELLKINKMCCLCPDGLWYCYTLYGGLWLCSIHEWLSHVLYAVVVRPWKNPPTPTHTHTMEGLLFAPQGSILSLVMNHYCPASNRSVMFTLPSNIRCMLTQHEWLNKTATTWCSLDQLSCRQFKRGPGV